MPRRRRTTIAGYPNYIILSSNKSIPIFRDNLDRENFLNFLKTSKMGVSERMKIFAYVLMDKFVYLIVLPDKEDDISRLVQNLGRRYVRYYNLKYSQSGPLFESRFKNFIIGMDGHLLTSIKYLESMPVKERVIEDLKGYDWSSYNFRAFGNDKYGILDNDPVYLAGGLTPEERQENYRRSFSQALEKKEEAALEQLIYKGGIFADEKTKRAIEESLGFRLTPKNVGRPKKDVKDRDEVLIKRKYRTRIGSIASILILIDISIVFITLQISNRLAIILRDTLHIQYQPYFVPFDSYPWLSPTIIAVVVILFSISELYTNFVRFTKREIFLRVGKALLFISLVMLSLIYMTRSFTVSRLFVVVFALSNFFALSMEKIAASRILQKYQRP